MAKALLVWMAATTAIAATATLAGTPPQSGHDLYQQTVHGVGYKFVT